MKKLLLWALCACKGFLILAQSAPGTIPTNLKPCTSTCTPSNPLSCGLNTITSFNDEQYVAGTGTGSTTVGAVWYFYNVATDNSVPSNPVQVNATIKIDAIYHAAVINFDDNNAVDQNGNPLPNLFAPTISPDQVLAAANRSGYVQFTISFFKNTLPGLSNKFNAANYTTALALAGLNYVHYDIDGTSGSGYELREDGLVKQISSTNPSINVNSISELNSYSYTGDGATWRGFLGSTCSRNATSNCSEVVASMTFNGALQSVTIRMGYDYKWTSGIGMNSQPGRLYGSTFGCFNFPAQSQLPITLLNFTGNYNNKSVLLNWQTENEVGFDHFEIQRSTDGTGFAGIDIQFAYSGSSGKVQYQYTDDLSNVNAPTLFYRLKMVDKDGRYSYSNVLLVRNEQKNITGISISPNPVTNGSAFTTRFEGTGSGLATMKIVDYSGKTVFSQQYKVNSGTNSIPVQIQGLLQPGLYILQINNESLTGTAKFAVIR